MMIIIVLMLIIIINMNKRCSCSRLNRIEGNASNLLFFGFLCSAFDDSYFQLSSFFYFSVLLPSVFYFFHMLLTLPFNGTFPLPLTLSVLQLFCCYYFFPFILRFLFFINSIKFHFLYIYIYISIHKVLKINT